MNRPDRTNLLLGVGLAGGALLTIAGLALDSRTSTRAGSGTAAPHSGTVATVNGREISRSRFEQALGLVERDAGRPLRPDERRHALDRLVDEELLLQKGQELGIHESDRKLRAELVRAVLDSVAAQAWQQEPSQQELEQFFEVNRAVFSGADQLRVGEIFVSDSQHGDARQRAQTAASRLRNGEDFDTVRRELGDAAPAPVPGTALPAAKLVDYVGPTAAAQLQKMTEGDVSDPIGMSGGFRVVTMFGRARGAELTFQAAREQVLTEYRRRAGEAEVAAYLEALRKSADIDVYEATADPEPAR